jgi:hypothetical protein
MFSPHCCGFYSLTGVIFMSFVYAMLSTQPFFVTGIIDPEEARTNALGALMALGALSGACALQVLYKYKNARGREYDAAAAVEDDDHNRLNIDLTYMPRTASSIRLAGDEGGVVPAVREIS